MASFREATGVAVQFLPGNDGDSAPVSRFCADHRRQPRHGPQCRVLGQLLARVAKSGHIERATCPARRTQVAVPVFVDHRHIGTLVAGPVTANHGCDRQLRLLTMQAHFLGECAGRLLLDGDGAEPVVVRRCKEYLAGHLANRLTLPAVARHVHLSPHHLGRVFKQATGLTVISYLQRARIERAKELLADADRPIKNVANAVGMASVPYFTRTFHRLTGETPAHYRHHSRAGRNQLSK